MYYERMTVAQLVERIGNDEVAGSNPVSHSLFVFANTPRIGALIRENYTFLYEKINYL